MTSEELTRYRSLDGIGVGVFTGEFSFEHAKERIQAVWPFLSGKIAEKIYAEFRDVSFFITRSQDYQDAKDWLELINWILENMNRYLIKGKLAADNPAEFAKEIVSCYVKLETVRDFIQYGLEQYEGKNA